MFSSYIEKSMISKLLEFKKNNSKSNKNNQILTFEFDKGSIINATVDGYYESDNGKALGEEGYIEYYACTIDVVEIINIEIEDSLNFCQVGELMELGYKIIPYSIKLDGVTIWEK